MGDGYNEAKGESRGKFLKRRGRDARWRGACYTYLAHVTYSRDRGCPQSAHFLPPSCRRPPPGRRLLPVPRTAHAGENSPAAAQPAPSAGQPEPDARLLRQPPSLAAACASSRESKACSPRSRLAPFGLLPAPFDVRIMHLSRLALLRSRLSEARLPSPSRRRALTCAVCWVSPRPHRAARLSGQHRLQHLHRVPQRAHCVISGTLPATAFLTPFYPLAPDSSPAQLHSSVVSKRPCAGACRSSVSSLASARQTALLTRAVIMCAPTMSQNDGLEPSLHKTSRHPCQRAGASSDPGRAATFLSP